MNTSIALNFMRSTKAPTISAGVIMKNVIWNIMNTDSGIVPDMLSSVSPLRNALLRSPT